MRTFLDAPTKVLDLQSLVRINMLIFNIVNFLTVFKVA
jgi:hypothetical protein